MKGLTASPHGRRLPKLVFLSLPQLLTCCSLPHALARVKQGDSQTHASWTGLVCGLDRTDNNTNETDVEHVPTGLLRENSLLGLIHIVRRQERSGLGTPNGLSVF